MKRIGVDVGGTFTDLILVDEESGRITVDKVPSTPDDPARGIVRGHPRAVRARPASTSAEVDNLLPRHDGRDEHRAHPQRAPRSG